MTTTMTGSTKQVAWAKRIREGFIRSCRSRSVEIELDILSAPANDVDFLRRVQAGLEKAEKQALLVTSASFWIDHRNAGLDRTMLAIEIGR